MLDLLVRAFNPFFFGFMYNNQEVLDHFKLLLVQRKPFQTQIVYVYVYVYL